MKKNNKGFSLVELIIVIAIMAVLVGVLAGQFIPKIEQSRQSSDLTSVQELVTAIEAYVADNDVTDNISIVITGGNTKTAAVQVKGTNSDVPVKDAGLKASNTLKSAGWPATITYTYNVSTYKWSSSLTDDAAKNSKGKNLSMNSAFTLE